MGKKFRQRRRASDQIDSDYVANHEGWATDSQDDDSGAMGTSVYSPAFPVHPETKHRESQGNLPPAIGVGDIGNRIDYELGGTPGEVNNTPYSTGVVSSDLVENFELDGRQAVIRRMPNPSDRGPVGTADHNMQLALALAQSVNQYYPNERSQYDVVRAV